jgi:hypothetical protein
MEYLKKLNDTFKSMTVDINAKLSTKFDFIKTLDDKYGIKQFDEEMSFYVAFSLVHQKIMSDGIKAYKESDVFDLHERVVVDFEKYVGDSESVKNYVDCLKEMGGVVLDYKRLEVLYRDTYDDMYEGLIAYKREQFDVLVTNLKEMEISVIDVINEAKNDDMKYSALFGGMHQEIQLQNEIVEAKDILHKVKAQKSLLEINKVVDCLRDDFNVVGDVTISNFLNNNDKIYNIDNDLKNIGKTFFEIEHSYQVSKFDDIEASNKIKTACDVLENDELKKAVVNLGGGYIDNYKQGVLDVKEYANKHDIDVKKLEDKKLEQYYITNKLKTMTKDGGVVATLSDAMKTIDVNAFFELILKKAQEIHEQYKLINSEAKEMSIVNELDNLIVCSKELDSSKFIDIMLKNKELSKNFDCILHYDYFAGDSVDKERYQDILNKQVTFEIEHFNKVTNDVEDYDDLSLIEKMENCRSWSCLDDASANANASDLLKESDKRREESDCKSVDRESSRSVKSRR